MPSLQASGPGGLKLSGYLSSTLMHAAKASSDIGLPRRAISWLRCFAMLARRASILACSACAADESAAWVGVAASLGGMVGDAAAVWH